MSIDELKKAATECIGRTLPGFTPEMVLILRGRWGVRKTRRLFDRKSPSGEILREISDGRIAVMFNAQEVLDWCNRVAR